MFSGIVEAKSDVLRFTARDRVFELAVMCPEKFNDLSEGDSIAVKWCLSHC